MPVIPVVVEGDTDAAVLRRLIPLVSLPQDTTLEPNIAGGKDNIPPASVARLLSGVGQLVIWEDLNHREPELLSKPVEILFQGQWQISLPQSPSRTRGHALGCHSLRQTDDSCGPIESQTTRLRSWADDI